MPPAQGICSKSCRGCDFKYLARVYRLTVYGVTSILGVALMENKMPRARATVSISLSILLSISFLAAPLLGNSPLGSGTVVYAESAHIGTAAASVGATVFAGDKLDTEQERGGLQIRAGAARLQLTASSGLVWGTEGGSPSATLTRGTAAFSTAGAKAFVLHAETATFRPRSNEPTIANVTLLNPKELVVRCSRGAVLIAVEEDVRVIPEGTAYRVVLDPEAAGRLGGAPAAATPARPSGNQNPPRKAGKSNFVWYAIAFTALVTGYVVSEVFESPSKP